MELIAGIDQHLSATADDTRRLTFTNDKEWAEFVGQVHEQLEAILTDLSHPAIKAQLGEMKPLQKFGAPAWRAFHNDLALCTLEKEFTNKSAAFAVTFLSKEVVVPRTTLHVAAVRFSFFYWIWYCHVCRPQQLQGKFNPDPPYTTGFFTFKPGATRDTAKTERALDELLSRASNELLTWAKQLGEYVESRVDPLRKAGPIIE